MIEVQVPDLTGQTVEAANASVAPLELVLEVVDDDVLEVVDLADRGSSVVSTLSGGQRRRLSLACALIHRPRVLFLADPEDTYTNGHVLTIDGGWTARCADGHVRCWPPRRQGFHPRQA